jgi:predicted SprT family Zn-dependent metalloprotease
MNNRKEEAERLGKTVSARRVTHCFSDSREYYLIHDPCDNGSSILKQLEGLIQTRKSDMSDSDDPENFHYQCKTCGEQFPYQ